MKLTKNRLAIFLTALILTCAGAVMGQDRIVRIARLAFIEGEVNYQKSTDEKDRWYEATANLPLDLSDQIYTGADGRAEVQFTAGNVVRVDHNTNLRIIELGDLTTRLSLPIGQATIRVTNLDPRRLQIIDASSAGSSNPIQVEISTPVVAVTLLKEGSYRVSVMDDGTTEITVREGEAEIFNKDIGSVRIKERRGIVVEGAESSIFRSLKLPEKDEWDTWNEARDERLLALRSSDSSRYVPLHVPGVADLDQYGSWIETPDYGWVWSPTGAGRDWAPYRHGCWRWYPSHGWAWIGHEPWGWIPYHYGRWAYFGNRWCWVPRGGGFTVRVNWSWSPSLVVFFGRRPNSAYRDGFSDGLRAGRRNAYDWIGWVPLAPGERAEVSAPEGPVTLGAAQLRDATRELEGLRNAKAPGGLGGVDGREFERSRVVVHGVTVPPRSTGQENESIVERVSNGLVKPAEADTPRFVRPARISNGRDLDRPVVSPIQRGTNPGVSSSESNRSFSEGSSEKGSIERANRNIEFRPAVRIQAPPRREASSSTSTSSTPSTPRPEREPHRDVQRESGRDVAPVRPTRPTRIDTPVPRRIERSESNDSGNRPQRPQRSEQSQRQQQPPQQQQAAPPPPPRREQSSPPSSPPVKVEPPPSRQTESQKESRPAPERPQRKSPMEQL